MEETVRLSPNVVILDTPLPNPGWVEVIRSIATVKAKTKVIILTTLVDRNTVVSMLRAGASGYLLKDCSPEELFLAIEAVTKNQSYLSPPIAHLVVHTCVLHPSEEVSQPCVPLTKREEGILRLITEGKTTRDIASSLTLSPRTVSVHRQRIMNKLKIHRPIDLIRYAIRQGLAHIEN